MRLFLFLSMITNDFTRSITIILEAWTPTLSPKASVTLISIFELDGRPFFIFQRYSRSGKGDFFKDFHKKTT